MLPFATKDRYHLSFIDALFEATSAVCVTGLVVVDTETTFTLFGQIVLMLLIQVGGLGFMTFGIIIAIFLGKNIGLKGRLMIQESLNQLYIEGMVRLVKFVVGFTLIIEGIGAVILAIRWSHDFGFPKSLLYGLFHSISAFNNAGFDLMGEFRSITGYAGDFTIIITLSSVVFLILFILTITENAPLNVLLFEVVSAFGTVGMSLGLTPELSTPGKVIISLLMFIGRVGPLTLAFALAKENKNLPFKYVEEKIMIG
jgi:Trk-type K+ transport system membrane component